jgi:hypothetical protein
MPPSYVETDRSEADRLRSECVLTVADHPVVTVIVRFGQAVRSAAGPFDGTVPRELILRAAASDLAGDGVVRTFVLDDPPSSGPGAFTGNGGGPAGLPLRAEVSVGGQRLPGPWSAVRLRVEVANVSDRAAGGVPVRAAAFGGTHVILGVAGGAFVSSVAPPDWARPAVEGCVNVGGWPVLIGPPGSRETMLVAPIVLYDHPDPADLDDLRQPGARPEEPTRRPMSFAPEHFSSSMFGGVGTG